MTISPDILVAHGDMRFFTVGGCVRDELLGVPTKDIDFAVEAPSYADMEAAIEMMKMDVFQRIPEFGTIRARFPKHAGSSFAGVTADFVMCRADGPSSDGRHPDFILPASIEVDLARRDFTVNAMARLQTGTAYEIPDRYSGPIIDPHGGQMDLGIRCLRFVGDASERLAEDALRAFRALRFTITKGFHMDLSAEVAINALTLADLNRLDDRGDFCVSTERIRDELMPCFVKDGWRTLEWMRHLPVLQEVTEDRGIWLKPSMEQRQVVGR